MKFIQEFSSGTWTVAERSRRHGISRKTAYKILDRFIEGGVPGLADRSRARRSQAHQTSPDLVKRIVVTKRRSPCWGPRKLLVLLERRFPDVAWPAKSTVGDILKRHGLVTRRRRSRGKEPSSRSTLLPPSEPNDLWCTDFKGYRMSGAQERLEPFTLGDAFSRYSLKCTLVHSTSTESVWPIFVRAFHEYGLPRRIRSDNGPPFASNGLAGISRLSIRFIRLGIRPERIEPGKPQQNGMLERFHLTLEIESMSPPAPTRALQEEKLEKFRRRFNHVRPHEALDDRTPADVYVPSTRSYPRQMPEFEYASHVPVRSVHSDGSIKWPGHHTFLSEALAGERVGFHQSGSTTWAVRLGPVEVALFDEQSRTMLRHDHLVWVDESQG